ncbi:ATP-binding protein [Streptomyces sp. PTM05]|uniref:ATP-binding protein n=1 Tax=Streptantibioticus parmotrematis TaxID=2873249 RepID=A0ABS7QWE4_9ACTN|nr:ATP-binding protein [Streptantibioticus parmotrematis]MBY8887525.1 ATP-binding protein [Streptantibioticus parmotrematis]
MSAAEEIHHGILRTVDVGAVPRTAGEARSRVKVVLARYGTETGRTVSLRTHADVLLAVSELATNAIRHGEGLTAFDAAVADDTLRVDITDGTPLLPKTATDQEPLAGKGGLGWPIIQQLADRITITPTGTGKTITVHFPLELTPPPATL